jgi:phosphoribosyl-ATP pyrophosphohydrolase
VKTFDDLYAELVRKASYGDDQSGTVRLLEQGVHAVGKKVVEEAAESRGATGRRRRLLSCCITFRCSCSPRR